jgi:FAD-dependent monooxygenase
MPLEPWQRVSQEIFEDFLRKKSRDDPLIDLRAGWNVSGARKTKTGVELKCTSVT